MKKRFPKWMLFLAVASFLFFIIIGLVGTIKSVNSKLNYQFNGRVDTVKYGEIDYDTYPIVIIHGKTYSLLYSKWHFGRRIQKGDSLIKNKNTSIITLIKHKGKKYIFGD